MAHNENDRLIALLEQLANTSKRSGDSFSTFTDGFMRGWPLIVTMAGISFFVINQLSAIASVNSTQQLQIEASKQAITQITDKLDNFVSGNADIVRRLDNMQKDIEIIKSSTH